MKDFIDFDIYSRALIATGDDDPTYPFIKSLCEFEGFALEWFTFVYVSFYNLESAIKVCRDFRTQSHFDVDLFEDMLKTEKFKFGHERRGTQRLPDRMCAHLTEAIELIDQIQLGFSGLLETDTSFMKTNNTFRNKLQTMTNVGSWSAFKIAELFEKTCGYKELKIMDLGIDEKDPNSNDGAVGGLRHLFGLNNKYTKDWFPIWNKFGTELSKAWGVDIGKVETCLCKWHKLKTGKYYVGHDLDEFHELETFLGTKKYHTVLDHANINKIVLSSKGILKEHKKTYRDTGVILKSEFADKFPSADIKNIILNL